MILQSFTMEVVYRYISVVPLPVTYKYDEIEAIMCSISCSINTVQKMKFSIKDFFSKCDQIRRKLRIWSYLLKKSFMKT